VKYGEKVPGKECGECSACCTVMGVEFPKSYKDPGVLCKHTDGQGGCSIYAKRPVGCQNFLCAWLTIAALPDFTRPDRLGVHLHYDMDGETWNPFTKACVIASPVADVKAMHSGEAKRCYKMFWDVGTPVCFNLPNRTRFFVNEDGIEIPTNQLLDYHARIR